MVAEGNSDEKSGVLMEKTKRAQHLPKGVPSCITFTVRWESSRSQLLMLRVMCNTEVVMKYTASVEVIA